MKIDSSRQTYDGRTNERTKIVTYWAPVGAKKSHKSIAWGSEALPNF